MRRLTIAVGLLAALAACEPREAEAPPPVALDPAAPEPTETLTPEEADALAFRAAWDDAAPVTASDPDPDSEIEGSFEFTGGTVRELGAGLYALVSSGVGENGAGVVAVHYLYGTEDGFRRNEVDPLFVAAGSGGDPEWSPRADLTPSPAILIEAPATGNGHACVAGALVELTPSQPVLRADEIPLRVADAEADQTPLLEGRLASGQVGRDFSLQLSGASDAAISYVLTDIGAYRAMGEPGGLPGC